MKKFVLNYKPKKETRRKIFNGIYYIKLIFFSMKRTFKIHILKTNTEKNQQLGKVFALNITKNYIHRTFLSLSVYIGNI